MPKLVFSHTPDRVEGNTRLATGGRRHGTDFPVGGGTPYFPGGVDRIDMELA